MKRNRRFFHFNDLKISLHPEVYEPAEDTFLFLDAIDVTHHDSVFEIGTGTGIISLYCAQKGAQVICSDINPHAVHLTKKNIIMNESLLTGSIKVRLGHLFDVFRSDEKADLIIFNPPYLPTKEEESVGGNGWLDTAVSGGESGLLITKMFLDQVSDWLKPTGRAFTMFSTKSSRNHFDHIIEKNQLEGSVVTNLSFTDETIEVHRITQKV